jgi:hypothetical protein
MVWCTTKHNDQTENQETDHGNDLDGGEAEFGFAVDAYGENVQAKDDNNDDSNPDSWVVFLLLVPKINEEGSSRDLGAECNRILVPVVPSGCETKSWISVTSAVLWDSTGQWQPCSHLPESLHHGKNSDTGNGVAKEDGDGTSIGESLSDTKEQPSTDGTCERKLVYVSFTMCTSYTYHRLR